jgi:hypothetical protein
MILFDKNQYTVFFLGFIFFTFISSCGVNYFRRPQPIDGKIQKNLSREFHGLFKSNDEDLKIDISSKQVNFIVRTDFSDAKKVYFKRGNKEFVVSNGRECQIFNTKFKNDSVFGRIVNNLRFTVDSNLVVKKNENYFVFNFQETDPNKWVVFLAEKSDFKLHIYDFKYEIEKRFKRNGKDIITEDFDTEDLIYFFKRKEDFLSERLWLNLQNKRIETNED